jgi:Protein of unknown function (DUF2442)
MTIDSIAVAPWLSWHPGLCADVGSVQGQGHNRVGWTTLALQFEDGTEQRIDFRPVLEGKLFGPLQNPNVFNAVSLDKEIGTLTWPNGASFDPTTLHDWPQVRDQLVVMARGRAEQESGTWHTGRKLFCRGPRSALGSRDPSVQHPAPEPTLGVPDRVIGDLASERQSSRSPLHPPFGHA